MRHKKVGLGLALLVIVLSAVLGATVLREPIAYAASSTPFQNVIVMNSDSQPIPVKQQGKADVRLAASQSPWHASEALSFLNSPTSQTTTLAGPTSGGINLTHLDVAPSPTGASGEVVPEPAALVVQTYFVAESSPATGCSLNDQFGEDVWRGQYIPAPLAVAFPAPIHVAAPTGKKVCLLATLLAGSGHATLNASGFYSD